MRTARRATPQSGANSLKPELDQLLAAFDVEPDARAAFAEASLDLFAAYKRVLADRGMRMPPVVALVVLENVCLRAGRDDHAAGIATVLDYIGWARGESAKLKLARHARRSGFLEAPAR